MSKIKRTVAYLSATLVIAAAVAVPAHALDGSDGRFGIGKGRYDHFKPDPKRATGAAFPKMTPCPQEDSRECGWDAVHQGNGSGQSFLAPPAGVARVNYSHAPVHRWNYGDWAHVPDGQLGNRVDLINGGSRLVGDKTIWRVGPTTYWAWPGQDRIDYQLGTS